MTKLVLPLQSYQTRSVRGSSERLINLHAVAYKSDGTQTTSALYPTPGLDLFYNLSGNTVRMMIEFHGNVYIVYDNQFVVMHYVAGSPVIEVLGTINSFVGHISVATIFNQILFVDGINAYHYQEDTAVYSVISDPDFPVNCSYIEAQDSYFFALQPNSDTFYLSDVADGTSWDSLRTASASVKSNNIVAMLAIFEEMWLLCEQSTEIWFDAGGANFPYQPQGGSFINYGCAAPYSVKRSNTGAIWLAKGGESGSGLVVYAKDSNTPAVISTQAMHDQFDEFQNLNDAEGFVYQQQGIEFYVLTFPTDCRTFAYNITADKWHERTSIQPIADDLPQFTRWRPSTYAFFAIGNGVHLVGDYASAKIFRLNTRSYVEDTTTPIQRVLVTPPLEFGSQYVTCNSLELLIEPGQGTVSGTGINPQISLEISRDGGFTWGNKRLVSLGKIGEYKKRVKWNILGIARHFVFRFIMSDPVQFIVLGAIVDISMEGKSVNYPRVIPDGQQ